VASLTYIEWDGESALTLTPKSRTTIIQAHSKTTKYKNLLRDGDKEANESANIFNKQTTHSG